MSDTPRTDDVARMPTDAYPNQVVDVKFARELERELAAAKAGLAELIVLDGNWLNKWGSCRVCGGEIPHGHANNCDIFKQEKEIAMLRTDLAAKTAALEKAQDIIEELRAEIGRLTSKGIGIEGLDTET